MGTAGCVRRTLYVTMQVVLRSASSSSSFCYFVQAVKRLEVTMAWRRKHQPQFIMCHACDVDPRSHYMHVVGFCNLGRPVIYSCNGMAKDKSLEYNKAHMIQTFEHVRVHRASQELNHQTGHICYCSTIPTLHSAALQHPGLASALCHNVFVVHYCAAKVVHGPIRL